MLKIWSSSSNKDKIHVDTVCITSGFQIVFDQTHTHSYTWQTHIILTVTLKGVAAVTVGSIVGGALSGAEPVVLCLHPVFSGGESVRQEGQGEIDLLTKLLFHIQKFFAPLYTNTESVDIYRHFCKMQLNKYVFFIDSFILAKNKPTCTNPSMFSKCGCRLWDTHSM